jgi:hypothetical protein
MDLRSCKRFMPRTPILDHVQTAVDAQHHLIVAHDVTNVGHDRDQLSNMAGQAKAAMGVEALDVLADRDYFKGEEVQRTPIAVRHTI